MAAANANFRRDPLITRLIGIIGTVNRAPSFTIEKRITGRHPRTPSEMARVSALMTLPGTDIAKGNVFLGDHFPYGFHFIDFERFISSDTPLKLSS